MRTICSLLLIVLCAILTAATATAAAAAFQSQAKAPLFQLLLSLSRRNDNGNDNGVLLSTTSSFSQRQRSRMFTRSALYSTPPPRRPPPPSSSSRQPRRNLVKRQRRKGRDGHSSSGSGSAAGGRGDGNFPWETAESRSIVSTVSKEMGEDYWIDPEEWNAAQEQERSEAARLLQKREPGQIPNEKLWIEILSPYKQNWIGMMSVVVVVLATIVTKFPELVEAPTITIPDL